MKYTKASEESRTDHEGRVFDTVHDMCIHWGIAHSTYKRRTKRYGWDKKEALTKQAMEQVGEETVRDHEGVPFSSNVKMCEHWGIPYGTYAVRVMRFGWDKEKALTTPLRSNVTIEMKTDHTGMQFKSVASMCEHWGIGREVYRTRVSAGWSKEDALTKEVKVHICANRKENGGNEHEEHRTDHEGRVFKSIIDMCDHWGISSQSYYKRIKKFGGDKEKALTGLVVVKEEDRTDHEGRVFNSISDMCRHWNMTLSGYRYRVTKMGWTKEEALTRKSMDPSIEERTDHEGRVFSSIKVMCNAWGIEYGTYLGRIKRCGWSKSRALTTKVKI